MKKISKVLFAIFTLSLMFMGKINFTSETPGLAKYEGTPAQITLEFNSANAQDFWQCRQAGCSENDCIAATQNGFTCKTWKCFGSCVRSKGFYKGCLSYLPNSKKVEQCKQASNSCESKCKY